MTTLERVAYLKGLADGMKMDDSTNEGKLLLNIIGVLEDMAGDMASLEEDLEGLADQVDEIDDDLAFLEEVAYEDEDEDGDLDDEELYEVECPSCGDIICIDEEMLDEGEIDCPSCGEKLEFDLEDACDCGHDHGAEE